MFAEISFPIPLYKTFHYKIPKHLEAVILPGAEVICPFGPSKFSKGIVIDLCDNLPEGLPFDKIKEIKSLVFENLAYDFEALKKTVRYCSLKWYFPEGMYYGLFYENSHREPGSSFSENLKENNNFIQPFFTQNPGESLFFKEDFPLREAVFTIKETQTPAFFLCPDYLSALAVYKKISPILEDSQCAFYHGSISKSSKKEIFASILSGKVKYVIGTKAAVFLPYPKGTIISVLNCESDFYRQFEQRPFYQTRDIIMRMTADFSYKTSFFSCSFGLDLPKETEIKNLSAADKTEPAYSPAIIKAGENYSVISEKSLAETEKALSKGEKVLFLAPSRGVGFKTFCPICKWTAKCAKCKRNLRLFGENGGYFYRCPSCLEKTDYSLECPSCGAQILKTGGHGSQKISEELILKFPFAKILRVDSDSVKKSIKGMKKTYSDFLSCDYDILVGTSFILGSELYEKKFGGAVLLGLNPERSAGFRESENLFSKIISASRLVSKEGFLFIETYEPENPVFSFGFNLRSFIEKELEDRKFFNYPPFCDLLTIRLSSKSAQKLKKAANDFVSIFDEKKISELKVIDYRPEETLKTDTSQGISWYDCRFKIKKDSAEMALFLSSLELGKDIKISAMPDWMF
ncbi:MAG: hypothetical protein GX447_01875 [Elusimicrobia bacterium]|nr:hypothetical protein [Elusimicrobiota bacterium]